MIFVCGLLSFVAGFVFVGWGMTDNIMFRNYDELSRRDQRNGVIGACLIFGGIIAMLISIGMLLWRNMP